MRRIIFILCTLFVVASFQVWQAKKVKKAPPKIQAKLLVLSGDNVLGELDLKDMFVFILKDDQLFYTDTSAPGFFATPLNNLQNLGEGHQRIVRQALDKYLEQV